MLNDASGFTHVYLATGYTDLRKGMDSLALLIHDQFALNPYEEGNLFLFCGRRSDRIKGLLWEKDGFLLLTKRLANGKYQWPRNASEMKDITMQQYRWLMEGLAVEPKRKIQNIQPKRL